ncbi:amidase family protein [Subtercola sp. RTI3]|nr:amidase family protein [Subtercola sp. RTI3]
MQFSTHLLTGEEERAIWDTPEKRRPLVESQPYAPGSKHVGSLAGIRVAVKDLFAIAGEVIGAGNPSFAATRRPETVSSAAVQALITAGAEITGLAQTDELAFSIAGTNIHFGTPPNPAAPGHITGGSTSGPASAVALGLADLALGTDTAGSIRVPGSYTGLFGLRTTHNAVSRAGLVGLAPSFDTVGVLARDLRILHAGAVALLATGTPASSASPAPAAADVSLHPIDSDLLPGSPHVGLPHVVAPAAASTPITTILTDPALTALADDNTQLSFGAALRALALNSGASVAPNSASTSLDPADLDEWFTAFRIVQQFEAWAEDGEFVTENPGALDPAIAERFRIAAQITDSQAQDARATLARATATLEAAIPLGSALALPTTSSAAPSTTASPAEIDRVRTATLRLTSLASLSGLPALTIPYGRVGTLPLGFCLLGPRGSDLQLIALAQPRA